jgi:hypothetical protein
MDVNGLVQFDIGLQLFVIEGDRLIRKDLRVAEACGRKKRKKASIGANVDDHRIRGDVVQFVQSMDVAIFKEYFLECMQQPQGNLDIHAISGMEQDRIGRLQPKFVFKKNPPVTDIFDQIQISHNCRSLYSPPLRKPPGPIRFKLVREAIADVNRNLTIRADSPDLKGRESVTFPAKRLHPRWRLTMIAVNDRGLRPPWKGTA